VRDASSRHLFQGATALAPMRSTRQGAIPRRVVAFTVDERTYDGREFADIRDMNRGPVWTLGNDRDVGRDQCAAGRRDEGDRLFEQSTRRRTLELRVRVGEVAAPRVTELAAPNRASQSACVETSASEWPTSPGSSVSRRDPARVDASASSAHAMHVKPLADSHLGRLRDSAKPWRDRPRRDLHVVNSPGTTTIDRRGLQRARRRRWRRSSVAWARINMSRANAWVSAR